MKEIACFLLEMTDRARVVLRRFSGVAYGEHAYHDVEVAIGECDSELPSLVGDDVIGEEHLGDPRWPGQCSCGYVFTDADTRQLCRIALWSRTDTGEQMTLSEAPAGAMWFADWYSRKGPDGHCLVVKTPAGDWQVDARSSNGSGWTRTGTPPNITVSPSIGMGKNPNWDYHGWLRDGRLVEC